MTTYRVCWDDGQAFEEIEADTDDDAGAMALERTNEWLEPGKRADVTVYRLDDDEATVLDTVVKKLADWRDLRLVADDGYAGRTYKADTPEGREWLQEWRETGGIVGAYLVHKDESRAMPDEYSGPDIDLVDWTGFDEAEDK